MSKNVPADYISRKEILRKAETMYDGQKECSAVNIKHIYTVPSEDVAPVIHGVWVATRKHYWRTDKHGSIDETAWDHEIHNGPVCKICGFAPCVHCNPIWAEEESCREHFVCSVCGLHADEKYPYCHCGAKMVDKTYTLDEVKAELGLE